MLCVDDMSTGSVFNVVDLIGELDFHLVAHDVRQPLHATCDLIINMASPASPPRYQIDPVGTLMTNVMGTKNLLDLAVEQGARFLQASTSEVYGNPEQHPQRESYLGNVNTLGPRACYDEGKRAAETLCADYRRAHGVNVRIARIFNTYGPHMAVEDGRVVSNFVVQALEGRDLTIYGDGTQTRSFCYVDDLVRGLVALADSDVTVPVNLGNDAELSMLELADTIIKLVGSTSRIRFEPLPEDDPQIRRPCLERAQTLLDYQPRISLEEGIKATASFFDSELRVPGLAS